MIHNSVVIKNDAVQHLDLEVLLVAFQDPFDKTRSSLRAP